MDNYHKTTAIMALMKSLRYVQWDHRMSSWSEARGAVLKNSVFGLFYGFLLADEAGRGVVNVFQHFMIHEWGEMR